MQTIKGIDSGRAFDWGKTSQDYAKYRDIYPPQFYDKLIQRGLCVKGQTVLDIGTGTGVLPRNMYRYGAKWTGRDISPEQIAQARRLSEGMDIDYAACPTEDVDFPDGSFDVITACQCFWYFDHENVWRKLHRMLAPDGRILVLYMAWLPGEDALAAASEALVLRYNPGWTGAGETVHPIWVPACYDEGFERVFHEEYYLDVPFTRESWNGRMKACRGVGASLTPDEAAAWEREHLAMLADAPETFTIRHYAALAELRKK